MPDLGATGRGSELAKEPQGQCDLCESMFNHLVATRHRKCLSQKVKETAD